MLFKPKPDYYIKPYEAACKSNMNAKWNFLNRVLKWDFAASSGPIKITKGNVEITDAI